MFTSVSDPSVNETAHACMLKPQDNIWFELFRDKSYLYHQCQTMIIYSKKRSNQLPSVLPNLSPSISWRPPIGFWYRFITEVQFCCACYPIRFDMTGWHTILTWPTEWVWSCNGDEDFGVDVSSSVTWQLFSLTLAKSAALSLCKHQRTCSSASATHQLSLRQLQHNSGWIMRLLLWNHLVLSKLPFPHQFSWKTRLIIWFLITVTRPCNQSSHSVPLHWLVPPITFDLYLCIYPSFLKHI